MRRLVKSFATDETGATAIEYGLLAALIAVAIIVSLNSVASGINKTFNRAATTIATGS